MIIKLRGKVIAGRQVGRTLGFPTANIAVEGAVGVALADAADGVYAARVFYGGRWYGAMANLGFKPTFPGSGRGLELHLLDFTGNLYGEEVEVELIEFIRPERRFSSPEELRKQISLDKTRIEEVLGNRSEPVAEEIL